MSINTTPIFYFVDPITADNFILNFDEGIGELTAELSPSGYSPTELATEVARALNTVGTQTYTVVFDRGTRLYNISAAGAFDLLVTTGSNVGLSAYPALGFTSDKTSVTSADGDEAAGDEYTPQFALQDYRDLLDNVEGVQASINESGSGRVEVVTFGNRNTTEFNMRYITNNPQGYNSPITQNLTGVENARTFLNFLITKSRLEFMKDSDNRAVFNVLLLESTRESKQGTSFSLKEQFKDGLAGFFETGRLKFREIVT